MVIETPAFAPDHLSRDRPEAAPLVGAEAERARAALRAGWGIAAHEIGLLRTGGTSAANHLIDGAWVLKRRADAPALIREAALLRRAATAGVGVPRLRAPAGAATGVHVDDGGAWALYEFVPGTHFRGAPGELALAAETFVAIGRAFADAPARAPEDWNATSARARAALATQAAAPDAAAEAVLATHRPALEDALAADGGRDLGPLETLHTDLHPMNLLFDGGRAVALDFEDVGAAPRAVAAGFALLKLGREALSRTPPAARRASADELVADWRRAAPLDAELLRAGARRRVLANVAGILTGWRVRGDLSANHALVRQLGSLAEADFLFEPSKRGVAP